MLKNPPFFIVVLRSAEKLGVLHCVSTSNCKRRFVDYWFKKEEGVKDVGLEGFLEG